MARAAVANDYPFGPRFPSTDTTVPQRTQNINMAKQLLQQAGHSSINATLFTEQYQEIPQLAQAIQQNAKQAGININLKVETQTAYYGKSTFGNSDWLDGQMSLVDYGDRGVPNVYLSSPLTSKGPWNAAHFKNSQYDSLVKQYVAALDLQTQKQVAGKIERLLLQETPIVYSLLGRRADGIDPERQRIEPDLDRAAVPQHRVYGLRPPGVTAFILKRLGLALITLWILSLIVFFAGQVLPGDAGRAILGTARGSERGRDARSPARRRQAGDRAVLALDHHLPRDIQSVSGSDRPDPDERARALAEARGVRVHHRRATRHSRGRRGGAEGKGNGRTERSRSSVSRP